MSKVILLLNLSQTLCRYKVADENTEIIRGNSSLSNRAQIESSHFKSCYFSAILCILAKIALDVDRFRGSILDRLILLTDKIDQRVGKLRYKECRWFYNIDILNASYNIVLKEVVRADPKSSPSDELDKIVEKFLENDRTGILVLANCAYAFWTANDKYYLFDPYSCDEKGNANEKGYCCLMKFRDLKSMLDKIKTNAAETVKEPFRLYTVSIAHMRIKRRKRKRRNVIKRHAKPATESIHDEEKEKQDATPSAVSAKSPLIESVEWVTLDPELDRDVRSPGFTPIRNYEASMLETVVLEDYITTPLLVPFETLSKKPNSNGTREKITFVQRRMPPRIFQNHTSVAIPIDLCFMAWSLIHDPASWSERTIIGLIEASIDYAFDNMLASEDISARDMIDAVLPEFEIANYMFRAVLAPLHYGTLYATDGWNLAMTLERIFETRIYTGAIIVCGYAHIGVTKSDSNYFAWWTVTGTKKFRIITTSCLSEFLKLIVKVIDEPQEIKFAARAVTISYAVKMAPDCSDVKGLHEPMAPTTSLAKIYRKETSGIGDIAAIFRPIGSAPNPSFVFGTIALRDRDSLLEPRAKRCYFVALLAVVIKRDIVQSPIPVVIDNILEVAEDLYRKFSEPKFHSEQILRNVPLMNRHFDLRDCASPLVILTTNPRTGKNDFYIQVSDSDSETFFILLYFYLFQFFFYYCYYDSEF